MTSADVTVPRAMEAHGAYNRNSAVQAGGLTPTLALVERAAAAAALDAAPNPVVIADYGCSAGHNSLAPMALAIAGLRARAGADRAITVVHTDLPENDFSVLFQTLENSPDSYLTGPGIYPCAIGRSYFSQLLPPDSVTLGWCSWAVQWLSRTPMPIGDQIQIAFSHDQAVIQAFQAQAAEDWQRFLGARASELRPGGRLVVVTMATDDAGIFGYEPLLRAAMAALSAMADAGFLTPEELHRMAIPTVGRTRAAFAAPFTGPSTGSDAVSALDLESLEIFHAEDHIWERYEAHRDPHAWAAAWAGFMRSSVFPTLASALTDASRTAEFMDRLEVDLITALAAEPQPFVMPLAQLLIAKR